MVYYDDKRDGITTLSLTNCANLKVLCRSDYHSLATLCAWWTKLSQKTRKCTLPIYPFLLARRTRSDRSPRHQPLSTTIFRLPNTTKHCVCSRCCITLTPPPFVPPSLPPSRPPSYVRVRLCAYRRLSSIQTNRYVPRCVASPQRPCRGRAAPVNHSLPLLTRCAHRLPRRQNCPNESPPPSPPPLRAQLCPPISIC